MNLSTHNRLYCVAALFLCSASFTIQTAHAAEYTWSGASGGTWNGTNTNWSGAPADPWNIANGPDNVARFNSNNHNVEVVGDVFTNGINFAQTATLRNTGTINLVGSDPTIVTTANGNINANLAGTSGFTKTGNAILTLRGDNSGLSGTIFHTENRLSAGGSNSVRGTEFGSGTVDVSSGAFIRFFNMTNAATQDVTANLILRGTGNNQGALQNDGNSTANHMLWGGSITLAADARIDSQNSGRYTFNGDVGQSGGSHTLTLSLSSGTNTFNAGLTMGTVNHSGNGAVSFGADSVIDVGTWSSTSGSGAVNLGTATVTALDTLTTNRSTNLGAENQLTASTAVNVQGGTFNLGGFDQQAGVFTQTGGTVSNGTLNAASFALNGGTLSANPGGSGTISFGGGTLQQSDDTDHSSRFSTAASQDFRIDVAGAANTVTWATSLTSADSTLAKSGSGTLLLAGDNSGLSGTLSFGGNNVDAGQIHLGHSGALGGISTVNLAGSQSGVSGILLEGGVAFNQTITTAGRSNPTTTGYILRNLSGDNAWNGNITINNGGGSYGIVSDAGTLTLGGDMESTLVSTLAARSVTFGGDGDFLVTGDLRGGGPNSENLAITMDGAGTLTIAGTNNNYTGNTNVNAGTLVLNGTSAGSNFFVGADGTLGGAGTITGNVSVAGTLAPGNSIGTLTVNGDLTLDNDSTFNVEIDTSSATADQMVVSGAVNIGSNVALNLFDLGGDQPLTFGSILTLIDYSQGGSWNGGFFLFNNATLLNSDTFTAAGNLWRIAYGGDDLITLTVIPEPSTIALLLGLAGLGAVALRRRFRHG
jgi:fibronectin-binding autotransporter adhesin